MPVLVRERPPLRLTIDAETPGGQHFRWAADESEPATVPSGLSFSSIVPGGFDSMGCTLPRDPSVEYSDLARLTTITIRDAGLKVVGQYRLEGAPRVSGNQMSVSPNAVGWQAHLEDDKSVQEIYIDRDLNNWAMDGTQDRRAFFTSIGFKMGSASVLTGLGEGTAWIQMMLESAWATAIDGIVSYDSEGLGVGQVYWDRTSDSNIASQPDANFIFSVNSSSDGCVNATDTSGDLHVSTEDGESAATFTPSGVRHVFLRWSHGSAAATAGQQFWSNIKNLIVIGRHGLAASGTFPAYGLYASDVIGNAVSRWAPALTIPPDGISSSGFAIPHLVFKEATTVADVISTANRFTLFDWAVWEHGGDPAFYFYPRSGRGKSWRSRVAPAQLSEHGPDVARLWNGVVVRYDDVDGTQMTVGPPGSLCNSTDAALQDTDPENPANQRGIRRWDLLDMGGVSTVAAATAVGQIFLSESRRLDTSGQAQLVGYVEDDSGVLWPASHVRAGDTIVFMDAHDTNERRIVKADYSHDARTTSIDLDAPPDSLAVLLERLQVVLVPLGL